MSSNQSIQSTYEDATQSDDATVIRLLRDAKLQELIYTSGYHRFLLVSVPQLDQIVLNNPEGLEVGGPGGSTKFTIRHTLMSPNVASVWLEDPRRPYDKLIRINKKPVNSNQQEASCKEERSSA